MASPFMVTRRRKVHRRSCPVARTADAYSWIPAVKSPKDHACITCLGGLLPTSPTEEAPDA